MSSVMKKKEEAQFRRCASAVPNLIASMFDIGSVEARLLFRRRANVVRNSAFAEAPSAHCQHLIHCHARVV